MKKKKREFQSSELVKSFARIYGFEDKTITIQIDSPLLKNDFQMRRSFYLKKFQDKFGEEKFIDLQIL